MKKFLLVLAFVLPLSVNAALPIESFADIVEPLMPAVVNINTVKYAKGKKGANRFPFNDSPFEQFNELFEQFGIPFYMDEMPSNPKAMSLGSGFIVDPEGYIVTNYHVIKDADEISIKLNDNTELEAKLIGSDPRTDTALLKVKHAEPLPFVRFGESNKARVGDWIIAIGNPFGLGGTVTTGIISSKSRDIDVMANSIVDDYIQTDAAINGGNSGGPMFNLQGEVIGVNTAILAPTGTNIGIGFAIPANTVQSVVKELKAHGKINRGILGISIQEITPEIAEALGIKEVVGALVAGVNPGSAGAKAGFKTGDVIIEYNNQPVKNSRKLQILVAATPVNTETPIKIIREGKPVTLKAIIVEEAESKTKVIGKKDNEGYEEEDNANLNGINFADLTPQIREEYKIPADTKGVLVLNINKAKNVWRSLAKGDVIMAVNQQPITSFSELNKIYKEAKDAKKKNIVLLVKRNTMTIFLALPIL